jgi:ParB family transcriptional regulator, chromosome partitioning protein
MPKASRDSLKAKGKTDVYFFDPNDLVLVKGKGELLYDARVEDAVSEELVANIMYRPDGKTPIGIIEPVIGRRNGETGKVEVVAGRDRVKAAREANRRFKEQGGPQIRVPVWIRRMDDSSILASLVSENEHRRADSPLNRAKKLQRYLNLGHGEREAAALFGVSESTVRNMLRLLDAPAAVRNAVDAGKITASDGYRLAREEPDDAKKKLGKLLEVAPRAPGKKKQGSESASRARAILRGPEKPRPKSNGAKAPAAARGPDGAPRVARDPASADEVAETIAAWIEANWGDGNWDGAPAAIPQRIRNGEWRTTTTTKRKDGDEDGRQDGPEGAVGAVDP